MIKELYSGFLVLTYECNKKCRFCYASSSGFKKGFMSFAKIREYLKLMKSLNIKTIGLIGGEPTLHPDLFQIIRLLKEHGFSITLYTNGIALKKNYYVKKLKQCKLDFVNISIQDIKEKETRKGIENCHKHGMRVNVQTVISHSRFDVYKGLIDEFSYANLFIYYKQVPIIKNGLLEQEVLSNKETKDIYKKIFSYGKKKRIRTYLFARMPLCWWDEKDSIEKEIHENVVSHCHILNGSVLTVDIDGRILPCPHFIDLHMMNFVEEGRIISKKRFVEVFNKGKPERLRQQLSYVPHKKCKECRYFGTRCTGGCPLIEFELGPYAPFK